MKFFESCGFTGLMSNLTFRMHLIPGFQLGKFLELGFKSFFSKQPAVITNQFFKSPFE